MAQATVEVRFERKDARTLYLWAGGCLLSKIDLIELLKKRFHLSDEGEASALAELETDWQQRHQEAQPC